MANQPWSIAYPNATNLAAVADITEGSAAKLGLCRNMANGHAACYFRLYFK